jgi:hypothetical protein
MEKESRDHGSHVDEKDVISDSATDVDNNEGHIDDNSTHEKVPDDIAQTAEVAEPEHEYITGIQLWLVMASVTLVIFLMLLDISIIVTVSLAVLNYKPKKLLTTATGHPSNYQRFPLVARCWMVW